jgi:hypothetical protein
MKHLPNIGCLIVMLVALTAYADSQPAGRLSIAPGQVTLRGSLDRRQLLVTNHDDQRSADATHAVTYASSASEVAKVDEQGVLTPVGNGKATITATLGNASCEAIVEVVAADQPAAIKFEVDIVPILAAAGCSTGPCHGKARGQNGFQLSLLGFDPEFDYAAITQEARGRRVFPAAPEKSLLLLKASGQVPHGGGIRLEVGSEPYELVRKWIADGVPRRSESDPLLEKITVEPKERNLRVKSPQQLAVMAHYSDGTTRDVTNVAAFQSNESAIANVDRDGLVKTGPLPGEAAIMARYLDKIAIANIAIPQPNPVPAEVYADLPRQNFIDEHVWTKLQGLGIRPSQPSSESTWLRRVYVDLIGRLPSADEARAFLEDSSPAKRTRLVDDLLARPEYADFWANKWADLLRPNPYRVGIKAVFNFDNWIRESFRQNKPYDQFVREIVAAKGSTWTNGAATLFRDRRDPAELTTIVSQLFLGVRLECAKCHQHPFEVWGQDDFYSLAAYFARVGRKGTGLSPPISGGEEVMYLSSKGSVTHPLTGEVMAPRPLLGEAPQLGDDDDPRDALAEWITSEENPYFAQVIVNRVWADLMGRGIVEPVDDLRATNPPSNGPLLEALAADFREHGCDLKHLMRTITSSYVYGLSSLPNDSNTADTQNYSRHYRRRLRGEVLLDAASDITGVPETFAAMPSGSRAMQVWTHRTGSLFLDAFGRPDPNQDPPCERTDDTTVVQALHLMNAPNLHRKITDNGGRAAKLAATTLPVEQIVEELYLAIYSRYPQPEELKVCQEIFARDDVSRRQVIEDLMWAMMNTPEFVFKD